MIDNNGKPIRVGTKVKKQDKIGEVGKFGLFHFEVRPVNSKTMDTGIWTKFFARDETMEWAKYLPVNPDTFDFDEFAKGNSEVTLDKGQSETLPESKKEVKSPEVQEEKKPPEINFADGSKYVGDILNGKMHGQGTYIWASGDKYVGEFQNNRATGGWLYRVSGSKLWISQDPEGKWVVKGQ
ncbi:MAG: hypothetical protein A2Z08_03780 [Deltaproteobacteria bacterium RBG_16_54_11]|nr:MAG: hypothetical protein A2Z08_03780 [Deltaproteobacteria bacterium RBG_16_54_11]